MIFVQIAIAIGYPGEKIIDTFDENKFIEWICSQHDFYISCGVNSFENNGDFFGAFTKYGESENNVAGATSTSSTHAKFKSVIEAFERKTSGNANVAFEKSADELEKMGIPWIDPDVLVPHTSAQSKKCGLTPFTKQLSIQWTKGYSYQKKRWFMSRQISFTMDINLPKIGYI